MCILYLFLKNICNVLWSHCTFKALKQRFLLEMLKLWNLENMDSITTWKFLKTYFLVPLFLCNILLTCVYCSYILIKDLTLIFILQIPNGQEKNSIICFHKCVIQGIMDYYILIRLRNHVPQEDVQEYERQRNVSIKSLEREVSVLTRQICKLGAESF